jgi:ABC-2 type transport system ATP-binding protein
LLCRCTSGAGERTGAGGRRAGRRRLDLARHADAPVQADPGARTAEAPIATAARRLPEIVRDLDAAGVLLDDLVIRHPSLDDVFLTLTGHAADNDATTAESEE